MRFVTIIGLVVAALAVSAGCGESKEDKALSDICSARDDINKQVDDVARAAHFEHLKLPEELDYSVVHALSFEARQKLNTHRPETLGQASRISGITPAAISLLLVHLKKGKFKGFTEAEAA